MSAVLANRLEILLDRAQMLAQSRAFFHERGLMEVDVPVLTATAPIDPFIDLVKAQCMGQVGYFHSSPEYGMKRLLALGVKDCYQLGHVFRDNELGEKHNPEFTMAEWYHMGDDFEALISETVDFASLFLGKQKVDVYEYEEIFWKILGDFPTTIDERDHCFALHIEPQLESLTVIRNYPPEQAMLAKTAVNEKGRVLAQRFELFYQGVELANGYHELGDLQELRRRLVGNQQKRLALGKDPYLLDEHFLAAQIPDCCGVAVGFDRLMMLRHGIQHIREVVPFVWKE